MPLHMQSLKNLVNKVMEQGLDDIIDSMIEIDPRLVCRLNLQNKSVATAIRKRLDSGCIHPFHLLYDPEETVSLEPLLTTDIKNKIETIEEETQDDYFVDLYSSSGEWVVDFDKFTPATEWDASASDIGECLTF
jgi:hypothetical protein